MPGGSQLTQLKAALSNEGKMRQSAGKKRKRSERNDERMYNVNKNQESPQEMNPFSLKVTKVKHDIGGRKLKGIVGKPNISNQAGIEQVRGFL